MIGTATTRLVKVSNGDESVLARYNKKTGSINVIQNGKQLEIDAKVNDTVLGSAVSHSEMDKMDPQPLYVSAIAAPNTTPIDSRCNFFSSYCYRITKVGTKYSWRLTTPQGTKTVYETPSNTGDLHNFRSKVIDMKQKEIEISGAFGTGVLSTIIAGLSGAPATGGATAIVAVLVAAGAGITAAVMGAQLYFIKQEATYYFRRV